MQCTVCKIWFHLLIHISHLHQTHILSFPISFEAAARWGTTSIRVNKLHVCPLRTHLLCVWITFSAFVRAGWHFGFREPRQSGTGLIIWLNAWGRWGNRRIKEYQKYGNRLYHHRTMLELLTAIGATLRPFSRVFRQVVLHPGTQMIKTTLKSIDVKLEKPNECFDQTELPLLSASLAVLGFGFCR